MVWWLVGLVCGGGWWGWVVVVVDELSNTAGPIHPSVSMFPPFLDIKSGLLNPNRSRHNIGEVGSEC